jgi:Na+-transporting NADH:ubiquinone oxidoreductase subunit A
VTTTIRIKKGLDIPLAGGPEQVIDDAPPVSTVAVTGPDTNGLRPRMEVEEGDHVSLGQVLFRDRQNPDVPFTAPGAGRIAAVHRGARRSLQSVVIELDGDERESFRQSDAPASLDRSAIVDNLVASGLWTAFRTRPFSKIPAPDSEPAAIFVTAIDTNPHAADPAIVLSTAAEDFRLGLDAVARLSSGPTYLCMREGANIDAGDAVTVAPFAGPHPAGLVGTHIHFLSPVGENRTVWHVGYQDVIAIGRLFSTGELSTERVVALGGDLVESPRLLRTRVGANLTDLVAGQLIPGRKRIISGSVLGGRRAVGPLAWLGRYHNQVSVLPETDEREFLSWARPGAGKYSAQRAYAGHLVNRGNFALTSSQNGSPRAMVSTGAFERVMPLDILATPLLKALLVKDTDTAKALGCLELDEEDLALCSFVCNGKYEYGPFLRESLQEIEVNG